MQLGILYSFPIPDVGDKVKAFAWLSISKLRSGEISEIADSMLPKLSEQLSPRDRDRAKELFQELSEKYQMLPEFQP